MRLIIVRHGESVWNHEGRIQGIADPPLTERGRSQAIQVAERLAREFTPAAVYSSALQRASETAETIAAQLGVPLDGGCAAQRIRHRRLHRADRR